MSTPQSNAAAASQTGAHATSFHPEYPTSLRPSYFISRTDGTLVPLLPADELPLHLQLRGMGRSLTYQDTFGMQYVGNVPYTGQYYQLDNGPAMLAAVHTQPFTPSHARALSAQPFTSGKQFLAPDAMVRQSMASTATPPPMLLQHHSQPRPVSAAALATNWRKPATDSIDKTQAAIDAILSANASNTTAVEKSKVPASGVAPDQEKKVYCTHWIRHGECDYTQQGCLYKHEMPDKATLESIGFRTVPRWYLEKMAPKLEGMSSKPTVGVPMKASEWLKQSRASGSDDDDDNDSNSSDSSDSDGERDTESRHDTDIERKVVSSKPAEPQPAESRPADSDHADSKPSPTFSFELVSPPRSVEGINRTSTMPSGGDLIDLGPDLTVSTRSPAPYASPPSTSSSPLLSSGEVSPRRASASSPTIDSHANRRSRPRKVFVPAGESPDLHIAEARARVPRVQDDASPTLSKTAPILTTASPGTIPPSFTAASRLASVFRMDGMMASKHAPSCVSEAASLPKPESATTLTRQHSPRYVEDPLSPTRPEGHSAPQSSRRDAAIARQTAFLARIKRNEGRPARPDRPVTARQMMKGTRKTVKVPAATDMAKLKSS